MQRCAKTKGCVIIYSGCNCYVSHDLVAGPDNFVQLPLYGVLPLHHTHITRPKGLSVYMHDPRYLDSHHLLLLYQLVIKAILSSDGMTGLLVLKFEFRADCTDCAVSICSTVLMNI